MSNVIKTDINTIRRLPITMVIVDKDDLFVGGVDGLPVGTTVDATVDGLSLGTIDGDRPIACTEEDSSQMGVDPG